MYTKQHVDKTVGVAFSALANIPKKHTISELKLGFKKVVPELEMGTVKFQRLPFDEMPILMC